MYIFGAIDFSAALCWGRQLSSASTVTVVDAREIFATRKAPPDADEVVVDWRTAGSGRSRSTRAPSSASSRTTRSSTCPRSQGLVGTGRRTSGRWARGARTRTVSCGSRRPGSPTEIARIHSPIGLDLGARTPRETAIDPIAAEIVQDRWGGAGGQLKNSGGPIHAGAPR